MPIWAPGNEPARGPSGGAVPQRGFTLLELLIVVAIIALASAVVSLALPDPAHTRLEHEAARLATLLEAGRAQSRALGVAVQWVPGPSSEHVRDGSAPEDFHFAGLPEGNDLPVRWLAGPTNSPIGVELPARQSGLPLGPEPIIGAQRLVLRLEQQRITLATDGLGPFEVVDDDAAPQ
jgi:general secretion pathway protein H